MNEAGPGDRVVCKIADNMIVSYYNESTETKIFDVICKYEEGYLLYIPSSLFLKDTFLLTAQNYKKYGVDKKFIDATVCVINQFKILKIQDKIDGMCCARCNNFSSMAQANIGDKFYCWTCRNYYAWEIT